MKLLRDLFVKKNNIRYLFLIGMCLFIMSNSYSQDSARDSLKAGQTIESYHGESNKGSGASPDSGSTENPSLKEDKEDSVVFREVPDSVVKHMKSDRFFDYANNPAFWKNTDPNDENNIILRSLNWLHKNPWVRKSMYVLFAAILLVAIYIIVIKNKLFIFYSASSRRSQADELISENEDPDFTIRIQAAIDTNDYRTAIRYLYLKTLKIAGEKKLISLNIQSTNQDYLAQIEIQPIKNGFTLVTDAYEKSCYGGFDIRHEQFMLIKEKFDQLFKTLAA